MTVLLLHLEGPLQAYGTYTTTEIRTTETQPTLSAVVGLLAACQGRRRGDDVADLAALPMGVAVLREGQRLTDYHTISSPYIPQADGGKRKAKRGPYTRLSRRHYLADAAFVVGIQTDDPAPLIKALKRPVFAPYLGRRCCTPSVPLLRGTASGTLSEALSSLRASRLLLPERQEVEGYHASHMKVVEDVPLGKRRFGHRTLHTYVSDRRPILTTIRLGPGAAQDRASRYEMHRTTMRLNTSSLWHVEHNRLVMVADTPVDPNLAREPEWGVQEDVRPIPAFHAQDLARFQLWAKVVTRNRHRESPIKDPDLQRAWLQRQGERHGFEPLRIDIPFTRWVRGKHGMMQFGVQFRGLLRVKDAAAFEQALRTGIGRSRSLGFGLLLPEPLPH